MPGAADTAMIKTGMVPILRNTPSNRKDSNYSNCDKDKWGTWNASNLSNKETGIALAGVAQLIEALSCTTKGGQFRDGFPSRHIPRLQIQSQVGAHMGSNQLMFISLTLSVCLSPLLKKKKKVSGISLPEKMLKVRPEHGYKLQRQKQQRGKHSGPQTYPEKDVHVLVWKVRLQPLKLFIFQFQCAFSDLGRKSRNMVWFFLCVFHLSFLEISIRYSPNHKIQSHTPTKLQYSTILILKYWVTNW